MNRFILILVLFLMTFNVYSEDHSKVFTFTEKDDEGKRFVKIVEWYNEQETLTKSEYFFTEEYSNQCGFIKQNCYYVNGIINSYEMYYNEKEKYEHDLIIQKEFVNINDDIEKIEFTFLDNSIWLFEKDKLATANKFFPLSPKSIIDQYSENTDADIIVNAEITSGMSHFSKINELKIIEDKNIKLLKDWANIHKLKDLSSIYNRQIETIYEKGSLIILVQDTLKDIENYNDVLIYFYCIGALDNKPILVMIGFIDKTKRLTNTSS